MAGEPADREPAAQGPSPRPGSFVDLLVYALLGAGFAAVLAKSEAISWFRIQEMFRFQSVHMYGLMGSAVLTAGLPVRFSVRARARSGATVELVDKDRTPAMVRYWAGGLVFGLGWGLLGACPGPLYVLIGGGATVYLVALLAALLGTFAYGLARERLPH